MVANMADFPADPIARLRELEAAAGEAILGKHDVFRMSLAASLAHSYVAERRTFLLCTEQRDWSRAMRP